MSLYRRANSPYWWASLKKPNGGVLRLSSKTAIKKYAQEWHDKAQYEIWQQQRLGKQPDYYWEDAIERWLKEKKNNVTIKEDIARFCWLKPFLSEKNLVEINQNLIETIKQAKAEQTSEATANRLLCLVRGVLRAAAFDWEWIIKAPKVKLFKLQPGRIRFLSFEQVNRLFSELPPHQLAAAKFALATGLRQSNVIKLEWSQIDLDKNLAWIHVDQAKARAAIGIPLNEVALAVLEKEKGKHPIRVFTYESKPINQINTKAWKKALQRAGIENFRWHDLRHTWASWLAMAGTTQLELQELGSWKSASMVRRYAHLSVGHLKGVASKLENVFVPNVDASGTILTHCSTKDTTEKLLTL